MSNTKNTSANPLAMLDTAALTDIGLKRERNEDSNRIIVPPLGVDQEPLGAMFVVADGMGGLGGGDVASRYALDELVRTYYEAPTASIKLVDRLKRALQ